ncbi:hypothetical protein X771_02960 [Mesorhizobium sp. LSJC277A00]|nr:hypothetical protein X771_02960 [Mesorhizobium sp. LSJC277A00]ESX14479.1 hypothetical protein X768_01855 [Mesorhizobium sp. LSJC265A00]ESX89638.1 hypothetical protein X754_25180 [Mesorhizobium sp. LNJC403B00]
MGKRICKGRHRPAQLRPRRNEIGGSRFMSPERRM